MRGFCRGRDEGPMNNDSYMMICDMQHCRLFREECPSMTGLPPHWYDLAKNMSRQRNNIQCSGTESIHLFNSESRSATSCWSLRSQAFPRDLFVLLTEYFEAKVKIRSRRNSGNVTH